VISDALALAMADKLKHYLPDFPLSFLNVFQIGPFFLIQPAVQKNESFMRILSGPTGHY
jgi:hypothetical protein